MDQPKNTPPNVPRNPPPWACAWGEDAYGVFAIFEVGDVRQRMRWIADGTFWMGSPESEAGRSDDEIRHLVTLKSGFWLADTPCTQELWVEIMDDNPSQFVSEKRPVERVDWEECQEFLRLLSERFSELSPRLPTEAEWEYACRAGYETATWVGDLDIQGKYNAPILDAIAWYGGNSGVDFDLEDGKSTFGWPEKQYPHEAAGTRLVSTKQANPWGLHDMLGNVWEWCDDFYGSYFEEQQDDPQGPEEGLERVIRGGSWYSDARRVRAACRYRNKPGFHHVSLGFRLALGPKH